MAQPQALQPRDLDTCPVQCPLSTVHEAGASKFHNVPRKKRVLPQVTTNNRRKKEKGKKNVHALGTRNWNLPSSLSTPNFPFPPLPLCTYPFKVVAAYASISSSLKRVPSLSSSQAVERAALGSHQLHMQLQLQQRESASPTIRNHTSLV